MAAEPDRTSTDVELKPISSEAIPRALEKAFRYRLLNEPRDAESICRDILRADPSHQDATVCLLLSLTDQFGREMRVSVAHAKELLERIEDEYRRAYYEGVITERWAKVQLARNVPGHVVYDWFRAAMDLYEQAAAKRPKGNDDSLLRWNACARIIRRNDTIRPKASDTAHEAEFTDHIPAPRRADHRPV